MQVEYLNINEYTYRIEHIPYNECIKNNEILHSAEFVMIRNFTLINNIATDDNIYFIEREVFDKYKKILIHNKSILDKNKKDENNILVFPSNKDTMYYSTSYNIFNDTLIDDDLINELAVYNIYKKEKNSNKCYFSSNAERNNSYNNIPCDLIKIYHPLIKVNQQFIVHIENFINNIHFHYLCKPRQWFYENTLNNEKLYDSKNEYRYNNNIYSEYIKCYIPSPQSLFDRKIIGKDEYDFQWYFKEDLNIVDIISDKNQNFLNKTIIKLNDNNEICDDESQIKNQYVPLALFCQPWGIEEYDEDYNNNEVIEPEERLFKKVYFKYRLSIDNNYITTPLNISLYTYQDINKITNIYTLSDKFVPSSCSFINEYKFSLAAVNCFDHNGIISIIGHFHYPEEDFFKKNYPNNSLTEAYCFYHHVINRNVYTNQNLKESYLNELAEINSITDINDNSISYLIESGKAKPGLTKYEYIQILKESRWEVFLEDYIDEYKASIDFFGFRIEFASDKNFKHIFFSKNISIFDNKDITEENGNINVFELLGNGEFFFNITNLFNDWAEMPNIVCCRLSFIDRFIGNEIQSNEVYISKEKFKYIIKEENNDYRLNRLVELNEKIFNKDNPMIELNLNNKVNDEKFNKILNTISDNELKNQLTEWYANYTPYSFINNINCTIKRDNESSFNYNSSKNIQLVYKPIFFKTNQLNNLSIKYMQNQNIGIDLHEYMTNVDSFIITLDGNTYTEIGRNINYVIFNISAVDLVNESGTFEVYNQDHDYITYGNWSIVK